MATGNPCLFRGRSFHSTAVSWFSSSRRPQRPRGLAESKNHGNGKRSVVDSTTFSLRNQSIHLFVFFRVWKVPFLFGSLDSSIWSPEPTEPTQHPIGFLFQNRSILRYPCSAQANAKEKGLYPDAVRWDQKLPFGPPPSPLIHRQPRVSRYGQAMCTGGQSRESLPSSDAAAAQKLLDRTDWIGRRGVCIVGWLLRSC